MLMDVNRQTHSSNDETLAGKQISAKQQRRRQAKVFLAIFNRDLNRLRQCDRRVSQKLELVIVTKSWSYGL